MASVKTLLLLTATFCRATQPEDLCLLQKRSHPPAMLQGPLSNKSDPHGITSYFFPLPDWLKIVPPSDPDFESLYASAVDYAMGAPGKGGVLDFVIAETTRTGWFHRVYGGEAQKCGWWWTLPTQEESYDTAPPITMADYMYDSGVCPEWNAGTYMVTCPVAPGFKFVAGQGQSAQCSDGTLIKPPANMLQVNGDICSLASSNCTVCHFPKRTHDVTSSSCFHSESR
eukprot:TRINITY_DN92455_c0_g1_i1.p1 TRINITY_DN92455_c0_g1~~TRINITY_DN92455_c0_g1_i1.p1  ORF type:complete len:227 (+),score=24.66 TRINITY_DN92455_c0_g1_i1:72-752(+)